MSGPYKLILFDLDGVIVDSRRNMEVSWSSVCATFGIDVPFERYFALIGRPFADIMAALGLAAFGGDLKRVYDLASSVRIDLVEAHADCVAAIGQLRKQGVGVGLVTSKDKQRTLSIVRRLDMLFDVIECPDDGGRGKPNPDPLLRAMLQCGREPADTVYVGDMPIDHDCARRAGIDYIHAEWGYGRCPEAAKRARVPEEILQIALE